MLSKSQAKLFFLVFTAGFSLAFLAMTVDTIQAVPERSHEDRLSPEAVRGKEIWEKNNCMGCHTILGEGAYYAPELTKVYERRGPDWMRAFLRDPQAMFPGQRKMVQYNFTEQEISDLIAFFVWIGEIDTNGFPAKPDYQALLAPPSGTPVGADPHAGAPPIFGRLCTACHAVGGKGGNVGPALDHLSQKYDKTKLDAWLKDPQAVKPGTTMPNLSLSDEDRAQVAEWLLNRKP
jgi:nitric oxide reductase subunit C